MTAIGHVGRPRPRRSRLERQQRRAGVVFAAPAVVAILTFTLFPILMALWVSFRDWTGFGPPLESSFIGLDNYRSLLTEPGVARTDFALALRNNLYYVLGVVPTQTAVAFFLANLLNQRYLKGKGFFRTAYYFPSITSSIAVTMIFIFLFQRNGAINWLLSRLLPIGNMNWLDNANGVIHNALRAVGVDQPPAVLADNTLLGLSWWQWLSGPSVTMLAIMMLATWTTIGTLMLIFLAGLQNIPGDVEEASKVAALRAGDARAATFPRIYLDADIALSGQAAVALARALRSNEPRVAGVLPDLDLSGSTGALPATCPAGYDPGSCHFRFSKPRCDPPMRAEDPDDEVAQRAGGELADRDEADQGATRAAGGAARPRLLTGSS
jgi:ABC-type sugar transport system permease subunit